MVGTQIIIIIIHPARVLTSPRFVTTWLFGRDKQNNPNRHKFK